MFIKQNIMNADEIGALITFLFFAAVLTLGIIGIIYYSKYKKKKDRELIDRIQRINLELKPTYKIKKIGIDIDKYTHETMEAVKVDFDEEVAGIIQKSKITLDESKEIFEYLELFTLKNNKKKHQFSLMIDDERFVKSIVDLLVDTLGQDKEKRKEFNSIDLDNIRNKEKAVSLRYWKNSNEFASLSYGTIKLDETSTDNRDNMGRFAKSDKKEVGIIFFNIEHN